MVEMEYRRRDHEGGGWPGTNEDILRGLEKIEDLAAGKEVPPGASEAAKSLRPKRFLLLGHSAGGCLALWAAHQRPGMLVLAAAPVADLVKGYEMKVSDEGDAVELYMPLEVGLQAVEWSLGS